jgi:hypothetical protein
LGTILCAVADTLHRWSSFCYFRNSRFASRIPRAGSTWSSSVAQSWPTL